MKFETLILQTLFGACLLVCVLTFGAMITYRAPAAAAAGVAASATVGSDVPQAG